MVTDFLVERFRAQRDTEAVIADPFVCTYGELLERWHDSGAELDQRQIGPGAIVGLEGEFSPNAIALFLALLERGAVVVMLSSAHRAGRQAKENIAQNEVHAV